MKVPVEWLRASIDLGDISDEHLADLLTMAGLEVEEMHGAGDDLVFVTKVTPNRGDWLSLRGVAREAGAVLGYPLPRLNASDKPLGGAMASLASVSVESANWCPRYGARMIRNIQMRSSPAFMQQRLTLAGMRSINAVVDITNYVMLELGQPLHAFDYDTLPGGNVLVRPAHDGETLVTLDGIERTLNPAMLVIADRENAIGLAGIMGGASTEVGAATKTIFLEAAHFDPGVVRRGAKTLGLSTEASFRFERSVDPALVPIALEHTCELLAKYAGGEVVPGGIDIYPTLIEPRVIALRAARVNAILGLGLTAETISDALTRLGLSVAPNEQNFSVTVPTFRPDLTLEIDLVEEVGRMIGYENLPETMPKSPGTGAGDDARGAFDGALRKLLIGQGLTETYSHTLSAPSPFDDPAFENERVLIRLALSAELSVLRRSLLPHLLDALALNLRHRQTTLRLFEIGRVFRQPEPHEYHEPRRIAAVLTGEALDFFAAKGTVENLLMALRLDDVTFTSSAHHAMHPFRCADVLVNGSILGFVAEVDPGEIAHGLDAPQATGRIACFELDGDLLRSLSASAQARRYAPLPKYPSVARDLALLFGTATPYGEIEAAIRRASGAILESIALQSIYTGAGVPDGKKSVAVRLTLRSPERTLTDADAESALASVRGALVETFGATAR